MSWAVVALVMKTKVGSASGKAVLLALANHSDDEGKSCFPGQEAIEALTELSMDTIQRQIKELVSGGFITRKKRPGIRGRWASWSYEINLDKLADQAAPCGTVTTGQASLDQAAPCGMDKADQAAPCGVTRPHHAVSPGRTMRHEPFLKPINKPSRARGPVADRLGPLGAAIRNRIGHDNFSSWFGGAVVAEATDDTVTLELPTKFKAEQARCRFGDDVLACVQVHQSTVERVRFISKAVA